MPTALFLTYIRLDQYNNNERIVVALYSERIVQSPGRGSGGQSLPESGENFASWLTWCFELNN